MKTKTLFICQQCGQSYPKWLGKCTECGAWNSLVEEKVVHTKSSRTPLMSSILEASVPQPISQISTDSVNRWHSGVSELDRVLGGGIVPGSVTLIGGDPGIGKSTLLLKACAELSSNKYTVLYVSGEESAGQIAMRAERLSLSSDHLWVVTETSLERILGHIEKQKPNIVVMDSIQTLYSDELGSQPGSVGQVRECAYQLISATKLKGFALFLVGHVTKEGTIAGPKVLEHMVDTVLYFEGTTNHTFRILRSMKNRFGSTHEVGLFEMASSGLIEVSNPSEFFLSTRATQTPGSALVATLEGTRSLTVEVQALVTGTPLPMPRRTTMGIDPNRVALLIAIMEKRAGLRLFDQDIFINIVGGLRIMETAVDLGIVAAMMSSFRSRVIPKETLFFGELGLGGEIRPVMRPDARLGEASRLGIEQVYIPKANKARLEIPKSLKVTFLEHVGQLSDFL